MSQEKSEREACIELLTKDVPEKEVQKHEENIRNSVQVSHGEMPYLDYIFTIDIFNEGWEFPGGKIEEGEAPQEALKREILEELDTEIAVGELLDTIEYDYPTFHLSMDCFRRILPCSGRSGRGC